VEELRQAIELELLDLHMQPQIDLNSEACIGAELLLRWQRKNGEWVPPPQIIEMIEQNGWRSLFTDWLIRAAVRTSEKLYAAGVKVTLSINLTAGDLLDPDLPDLLDLSLKAWNIPGSRFILELTESAMMGDRTLGMAAIERLRSMGFQMSLDDFGTGYSSLSYLVSLPIHELKVDRSFVIAMFQSEENMRIVHTIIDLAKDLGMVSLAEGIDEARQLEQLRQLGCKIGQGFLFAKPMPLPDFIAWFKGRRN
jgi:sensor c-di-GMP phosphodiesterase-like protein